MRDFGLALILDDSLKTVTELKSPLSSWHLRRAISRISVIPVCKDLSEYLHLFGKRRIGPYVRYGVSFSGPHYRGRLGDDEQSIFRDSNFSLVLKADDVGEVACLGFSFLEGMVIDVTQIQGRRNCSSYLEEIKWERMLLRIMTDWARGKGFREIRVQPADQNRWRNDRRTGNLKLRYDVTARRSGFRYDDEKIRYVLRLCQDTQR